MAKLTFSNNLYRARIATLPRVADASADAPSLAWLLLGAAGGALSALVLAGVALAHSPWPLAGRPLLLAAALGCLPAVLQVVRGRWVARWPELAAMLLAVVAIGGLGFWLAWPSLLPLGISVDAAHHAALLGWVAEHGRVPPLTDDMQGQLGEMSGYPIGFVLVALALAQGLGLPPVRALFPSAALVGALIGGLVLVLASAASRRAGSGRMSALGLLAAPLLLLAHRTFLLDAYLDHSYYTMLLGVFLALLAIAWVVVPAEWSWGAAAQFGLALAALAATYPLWLPLPAALAIGVLLARWWPARSAVPHSAPAGKKALIRLRGDLKLAAPKLAAAYGPALAVGLADVLPRLRVGQEVLAHQGVVADPTPARLAPLALALLAAPLLLGAPRGRRLLGAAGLALVAALGLNLLAGSAGVASYHATKLLFVLTPLGAAVAGAGAARLLGSDPWLVHRFHRLHRYVLADRSSRVSRLVSAVSRLMSRVSRLVSAVSPRSSRVSRLVSHVSCLVSAAPWSRVAGVPLIVLALLLSGSLPTSLPARPPQLLSPDVVAAAEWLRANAPREAARAPVLGTPNGLLPYWVRVGLLGQRRDGASLAHPDLTQPPPSPASWLIDRRQEQIAIVPQLDTPPPDTQVLARFGSVAILQRNAQIDAGALNPLSIRYRSFWEDGRVKTAIELDQPVPGPLPLLELSLYRGDELVNRFALAPDPQRPRTQYLGADLIAATLGGVGYVNTSAYPTFAAPASVPEGALRLTLRLLIGGQSVDERALASFTRAADGQVAGLATQSGELVYLRNNPPAAALREATITFDDLRLTGWQAPAQVASAAPITVGLRWQALRQLDRSLFPELQLRDETGQPVAVSLAAPQGGFYPTWRWRPGEDVLELRELQPDAALAPGIYRLSVRIHDFARQQAPVPGEQFDLGTLEIVP